MKPISSTKPARPLATFAIAGLLQFATMPALAQSGTAVAEPPPAAPTPETPVTVEKPAGAPVSLTEATNSTGKTSGSGTIKELRFAGVDADSDGLISLSEFSVFMDAGKAPRTDSQAGISPTELLFRHMDRNSDNFLSEEEVNAYQKEQDTHSAKP
jgi:hypothetical protein